MEDGRSGYILVVEDDPTVRQLLVDTLEEEGYTVLTAADEAGTWEGLRRQQPDLVLLDQALIGIDTTELCRRLRAEPVLNDVPLLMLVARSSLDDRIAGLAAGADDYITKPFHPRELIARVATHLRRSERERNLNPLTHLPGNRAIERAAELHITLGRSFAMATIDINSLRGYNDRYGFAAGDGLIRLLADILRQIVGSRRDPLAMVGHIGGDDFLALMGVNRAEAVCTAVIEDFDAALPGLYTPEEYQRGYVISRNRRGEEEQIPLVGVTLAVVPVCGDDPPERNSLAAIAQSAAEIKAFLKRKPGSGYLIDRRRNTPGH